MIQILKIGELKNKLIRSFNNFQSAWNKENPHAEPVEFSPTLGSAFSQIAYPVFLGFFALVAIVLGSIQSDSPFTLKQPGAWFFGIAPAPIISNPKSSPSAGLFIGMIAVYGGLFVFMRAWWMLYKRISLLNNFPIKTLAVVLALWILPLIISPPLFSRDSYSYAGQGEMVSRNISPYKHGVAILGENANSYYDQVDKLWQFTPVPYGPLDLDIAAGVMIAVGHRELWGILGLRLTIGIIGVVLSAIFFPKISRRIKKDPSPIFAFGILNPIVILHLIGGIHNDALMVGFMFAGIYFAKKDMPVLGIIFCSVGALIKVPAIIVCGFIGWNWKKGEVPIKTRVSYSVLSGVISLITMELGTLPTGLGWGWINNLSAPNAVVSWMAPVTGLAILFAHISSLLSLPISRLGWLHFVDDLSTLVTVAVLAYLLFNSHKKDWLRSTAFALIFLVVLNPVVQPWYLSWGIMTVAFVLEGRMKYLFAGLSIVSSFVGLPGARGLVGQLENANLLFVLPSFLALIILLLIPLIKPARKVSHVLKTMREEEKKGDLAKI